MILYGMKSAELNILDMRKHHTPSIQTRRKDSSTHLFSNSLETIKTFNVWPVCDLTIKKI